MIETTIIFSWPPHVRPGLLLLESVSLWGVVRTTGQVDLADARGIVFLGCAASIAASCGDTKKAAPSASASASATSGGLPIADAAPVRASLPPWIQLRVGRVRIVKGSAAWDGPKTEASFSGGCKAVIQSVGATAKLNLKEVSDFGCNLLSDSQVQSDPALPDLQVQLNVHDTTYKSYIAFDQTTHTFDYPFAVPVAALTESGVVLSVVDADDGGASQEIGSVRVTKEQLLNAFASKTLMSLSAPGLELFEIEVSPADGTFKRRVVNLDSKKGGETVAGFSVFAGEVVRIEAKGSWSLGGLFPSRVLPSGPVDGRGDRLFDGHRPVPTGCQSADVHQTSRGVVGRA